jgi:hypothetical protein
MRVVQARSSKFDSLFQSRRHRERTPSFGVVRHPLWKKPMLVAPMATHDLWLAEFRYPRKPKAK